MEIQYENKEMCAKCKGECCKKGGCQYAPADFESLKYDYLLSKLEEGYISIVSILNFNNVNGKLVALPMLYLRARNTGREIVDLVSMRTRCLSLTENGCTFDFENRPSGGINLIPSENGCYPETDPLEFVNMWQPQQQVLRKLVKRISGKSVETKLKEDIYTLFKTVLARRFDGIAEEEIKEILSMIPMLRAAYPELYIQAINERKVLFPNDPIFKRR